MRKPVDFVLLVSYRDQFGSDLTSAEIIALREIGTRTALNRMFARRSPSRSTKRLCELGCRMAMSWDSANASIDTANTRFRGRGRHVQQVSWLGFVRNGSGDKKDLFSCVPLGGRVFLVMWAKSTVGMSIKKLQFPLRLFMVTCHLFSILSAHVSNDR